MKPPAIKPPKVPAIKPPKAPKVPKVKAPKAPKPPKVKVPKKIMKKVMVILLPILLIAGALYLLYIFVLQGLLDPDPDVVVADAIDAAQEYHNNDNESNRDAFAEFFANRCRRGLEREWRALNLEGYPRGSWYDMAVGMLNADGTKPEVLGVVGAGAEEEGEEEAAEGEGLEASVRIRLNNTERVIPLLREEGRWRINIPVHPRPRDGAAAAAAGS